MPSFMDQIENQKSKIENLVPTAEWDQARHWVESETGMDLSGSRFARLREAVVKSLGRKNPEPELRGILAGFYAEICVDAKWKPLGEVAPLVRRPVMVAAGTPKNGTKMESRGPKSISGK